MTQDDLTPDVTPARVSRYARPEEGHQRRRRRSARRPTASGIKKLLQSINDAALI